MENKKQQFNNDRNKQNNQQNHQQKNPPRKVKKPDPMGNPASMGRYAIKLIKDIAFGRCNIESCYDTFRNQILVQNAMNEVKEKIITEQLYCSALNMMYMQYPDARVHQLLKKHNNGVYAWSTVQQVLMQISQTGDPSPLLVLANRLPQFKYDMN